MVLHFWKRLGISGQGPRFAYLIPVVDKLAGESKFAKICKASSENPCRGQANHVADVKTLAFFAIVDTMKRQRIRTVFVWDNGKGGVNSFAGNIAVNFAMKFTHVAMS